MAGDFQKQFNEALKEAELDDVKKSVDSLRSLDPRAEIRKQLNPFEQAAADIRSGLDSLKPSATPAAKAEAHSAEPLKNGAAALPKDAASTDAAPNPTAPMPVEKTEPQVAAAGSIASAAKTPEAGVATAAKAEAGKPVAKAKPAAKPNTAKASAKPKAAPKPAAARKKPAGSAK